MAPSLTYFPDEVLGMIFGHFCLHCTHGHDYDAPDGYFRPCKGRGQNPDSSSWYPMIILEPSTLYASSHDAYYQLHNRFCTMYSSPAMATLGGRKHSHGTADSLPFYAL